MDNSIFPMTELQVGETATVTELKCTNLLKRRLIDMGITPGTKIEIKKIAPMGDPIEVHLREYSLSVRKKDAKNILVTKGEYYG